MFKNARVVMLTTNQESNYPLLLNDSNELHKPVAYVNSFKPQHLYIIEPNSVYNKNLGSWTLYKGKVELFDNLSMSMDGRYKIVATTDKLLNPSFVNLPSPSKSFIEKYIEQYNKGNQITDIMIRYIDNGYDDWISDDINDEPTWIEKLELVVKDDNTITIKKAKDTFITSDLPIDIIKNVVKYCEDNRIYDKLENYGDFYYKSRQWLDDIQ